MTFKIADSTSGNEPPFAVWFHVAFKSWGNPSNGILIRNRCVVQESMWRCIAVGPQINSYWDPEWREDDGEFFSFTSPVSPLSVDAHPIDTNPWREQPRQREFIAMSFRSEIDPPGTEHRDARRIRFSPKNSMDLEFNEMVWGCSNRIG
jgi:hypothetical protein